MFNCLYNIGHAEKEAKLNFFFSSSEVKAKLKGDLMRTRKFKDMLQKLKENYIVPGCLKYIDSSAVLSVILIMTLSSMKVFS